MLIAVIIITIASSDCSNLLLQRQEIANLFLDGVFAILCYLLGLYSCGGRGVMNTRVLSDVGFPVEIPPPQPQIFKKL